MSEKRSKTRSREPTRNQSRTDWEYLDRLTDEEITAAVMSDAYAAPLDVDWSEAVLVVPPNKKAISIRLDRDVLEFFKQGGAGYQRRINAVLRAYMEHRRKRRKRA